MGLTMWQLAGVGRMIFFATSFIVATFQPANRFWWWFFLFVLKSFNLILSPLKSSRKKTWKIWQNHFYNHKNSTCFKLFSFPPTTTTTTTTNFHLFASFQRFRLWPARPAAPRRVALQPRPLAAWPAVAPRNYRSECVSWDLRWRFWGSSIFL